MMISPPRCGRDGKCCRKGERDEAAGCDGREGILQYHVCSVVFNPLTQAVDFVTPPPSAPPLTPAKPTKHPCQVTGGPQCAKGQFCSVAAGGRCVQKTETAVVKCWMTNAAPCKAGTYCSSATGTCKAQTAVLDTFFKDIKIKGAPESLKMPLIKCNMKGAMSCPKKWYCDDKSSGMCSPRVESPKIKCYMKEANACPKGTYCDATAGLCKTLGNKA